MEFKATFLRFDSLVMSTLSPKEIGHLIQCARLFVLHSGEHEEG